MIPKILHHIWIGPKPAPIHWMQTWIDNHPIWEYHLWDNDSLTTFDFLNISIIQKLVDIGKYDAAADIMRCEILYKYGGFMPGADCESLLPVDELLSNELITVYENENHGKGRVSPIIAATPKNSFLKVVMDYFMENQNAIYGGIKNGGYAYILTGNQLIQHLIMQYNPSILILPSNALIGQWVLNDGKGNPYWGYYTSNTLYNKRYAIQHWGTGRRLYTD
jgi:mannosyltransferase OCH1-like enzyme